MPDLRPKRLAMPQMEQDRIMGVHDWVLVWNVITPDGILEQFTNYDEAYNYFVYLVRRNEERARAN